MISGLSAAGTSAGVKGDSLRRGQYEALRFASSRLLTCTNQPLTIEATTVITYHFLYNRPLRCHAIDKFVTSYEPQACLVFYASVTRIAIPQVDSGRYGSAISQKGIGNWETFVVNHVDENVKPIGVEQSKPSTTIDERRGKRLGQRLRTFEY
jgi:hypothetical protein